MTRNSLLFGNSNRQLLCSSLLLLFPLCFFCCEHNNKALSHKSNPYKYQGLDYTIFFQEKFIVHQYNNTSADNYFDKIISLIRFCPNPEYDPHVQQVISSDGFLCSLKILPPYPGKNLLQEINQYYLKKAGRYGKYTKASEEKIGKINGFVWKLQMGKSRLYYYLIQGKRENYLFISSPYGNSSYLEDIIKQMKSRY